LFRLDGFLREEVKTKMDECLSSCFRQENNSTSPTVEEKTNHLSVDYRNDQSKNTLNYTDDVSSDCELEESADDVMSEASSSGLPESLTKNKYPLR
jgi:hypothetical protein